MADAASMQRDMDGMMDAGRNLWAQWMNGAKALGEQVASPRFGELYAEQLNQAESRVQSALGVQRQWLEQLRSRAPATQLPLAASMNGLWWDALAANLELREQLWHTGFEFARSTEQQLRTQSLPRLGDQTGLLDAWRDMSRKASARYQEWLQIVARQTEAKAPAAEQEAAEEEADSRPTTRSGAKNATQRAAKTA